MQKYLIVGLGNIGAEYAHTRHNAGFDVVDALAKKHNLFWQVERLAERASFSLKGRQIVLIKPTTFMNLSGRAFMYWMQKEGAVAEQTLTVVDDLALPLSKLRLRPTGTHAGHNGLKDIQLALGTDAYPKLRFGIGNNFATGRQAEFVLAKWLTNERPAVIEKIDICVAAIEMFVLQGIQPAMTAFNNTNVEV